MDYEKLKEKYHKNGTDYELVKRNDLAAMYKQFLNGVQIGYEVFVVKIQPSFTFPNGTINPSKEGFPSNENFGKTAWSFNSIEKSNERYEEITKGIIHPERIKIEKEIPKVKRGRGRPRKHKKGINKVRVPKKKFVWEGKEFNSKSEVARILLTNGENKHTVARKLGVTVQTVHAVHVKMKRK